MFRLAHLSDPHLPLPPTVGWRDLATQRLIGYLSYRFRRKRIHDPRVLAALVDDLHRTAPDHIAVTGDLTNIALPGEFEAAAQWLGQLGPRDTVTVVPGNHDAYVDLPWHQSLGRWSAFMSDLAEPIEARPEFPIVRRRGELALIGVSSAAPSPPFHATGWIGREQLGRLARHLKQFGEVGLFRLILIHHPPVAGMMRPRLRLTDLADFLSIIEEFGAELVLHGHSHRHAFNQVSAMRREVPVIGVPSASATAVRTDHAAGYHLYTLRHDENRWQLQVEARGLAATPDRFETKRRFDLTIPNYPKTK